MVRGAERKGEDSDSGRERERERKRDGYRTRERNGEWMEQGMQTVRACNVIKIPSDLFSLKLPPGHVCLSTPQLQPTGE